MGLSATERIWIKCSFGPGVGRGVEGLMFRAFSMPYLVVVYLHAFMVGGGKGFVMVVMLGYLWLELLC